MFLAEKLKVVERAGHRLGATLSLAKEVGEGFLTVSRSGTITSRVTLKTDGAREATSLARTTTLPEGTTRIRVVEVMEGDRILGSRRKGERHRAAFEAIAGAAPLVLLDFEGADVLTPSFFFAGLWGLWERSHIEQFPLLANLPAEGLDDVELMSIIKRNPMWTVTYSGGRISDPRLVGDLEERDAFAIDRVFALGMVTASNMFDANPALGVTGWNNRLAGLWQKKVLARRKYSRMFGYRLPWRSDDHG